MARDADTIQAEIERARDALAITVDELTTRANPKRLADQGKRVLLARLSSPPIKYSLIGVGVLVGALIIRRLFR